MRIEALIIGNLIGIALVAITVYFLYYKNWRL